MSIYIAAFTHLFGHFQKPILDTEVKKTMHDLMATTPIELDRWFTCSIQGLFDFFSLWVTVSMLMVASICVMLARGNASARLIMNVCFILMLGFLAGLILSWNYAFSVPVILFSINFILIFSVFYQCNNIVNNKKNQGLDMS